MDTPTVNPLLNSWSSVNYTVRQTLPLCVDTFYSTLSKGTLNEIYSQYLTVIGNLDILKSILTGTLDAAQKEGLKEDT